MDYFYLALIWILYFTIHSILASNFIKGIVRNKFFAAFPFYRIAYNLIALVTLLFVLQYQGNIASKPLFQVNFITQLIGYGIALLGMILGYLAFKNYSGLEFSGLDFNAIKKNKLDTSGFNKYIRHPLYFASLLIVWGYFLSKPTLSILIMTGTITTYLIVGTKLEEHKLKKEFGEAYKQYIKDVPMLLPISFLKSKKSKS